MNTTKTYKLPLPKRVGTPALYRFWEIPEGEMAIFHGTTAHKINSALYQFKKTYGGEYSLRTISNESIGVWCLKAPSKCHPDQMMSEYQKLSKTPERGVYIHLRD